MNKITLKGEFQRIDCFYYKDSISFYVSGAINFIHQIDIKISSVKKENYIETSLKNLKDIINYNFKEDIDLINDKFNELVVDTKEKNVYYKCFTNYYSSGIIYTPEVNKKTRSLSLERAIDLIKEYNMKFLR